jgi:hypothetical protein
MDNLDLEKQQNDQPVFHAPLKMQIYPKAMVFYGNTGILFNTESKMSHLFRSIFFLP